MAKKLLIATTIALSAAFTPLMTYAEEAPAAASTTEMPKEKWLNTITPLLPDLICKGFMNDADVKKRFDEIKMTSEQCVSLIPESTKKCQDQLFSQLPDNITSENAPTWSKSLGECIGKDFAEKYLVPKQQ